MARLGNDVDPTQSLPQATALLAGGPVLTVWVPAYVLVTSPTGRLLERWQDRGYTAAQWPEGGAIVPAGLLADDLGIDDDPGRVKVVNFGPVELEQLRDDLLAFSPRCVPQRRKLDNPKHVLEFVNRWGIPVWGSFLGAESVKRVADQLRPFVEASFGPPDALRFVGNLTPATEIKVSATIRRVDEHWTTQIEALQLRDILLMLVQDWTRRPVVPCEAGCGRLVHGPRYCGPVCANRVQTRRAKKMQRVRRALGQGETAAVVAQRYGVSVAEVLVQRQGVNVPNKPARRRVKAGQRRGTR